MNRPIIMKPGRKPAMNSLPIETWAVIP